MEFNATFLATIISFIIFALLMNKILYEPILSIMEKRKNYIDGNYKEAGENNEKANAIISEIEEKRDVARSDARSESGQIIDDFKNKKAQLIQEARQKMRENVEKANVELESVSINAKDNLKNSLTTLASEIVEKVIGYKVEIQDFENDRIDEILYK